MQSIFLGIVSLFSLSDYQVADEIYIHPDSKYEVSSYSYSQYTIITNDVERTCFLDAQMRGICYQACYDDEYKVNNKCVKR